MTSAQIRQSFLDFFKSKQHTIVRSSPLDYRSRDGSRIFTNAGMNQFVPIFLGEQKPDVDKWGDAVAKGLPTRAADTQKCIRATGKHNDLEDVGLDTYHHTFFEMLGNWSFGDYFKKEAIEWAWELITSEKWWGFPKERLYATVYKPGAGDPAAFDQEAYDIWAGIFQQAGLDPKVHIVFGNKKDNFWMMGDTGPCGPCSEIHVDLTPKGDTGGSLVNKGDARCIEIWNLVFIQFNANPDGTFSPLPAKHVDTGMGFERVTSIMQCTKGFTNFAATISNYETDIFRPIFDKLEQMSGKKYTSTLPGVGQASSLSPASNSGSKNEDRLEASPTGLAEQEKIDVAFRVIADHIRTLSFAIADGIQPGNNDRNYVLRRILRRAVRYGRTLGFHKPFFYELVDVLGDTMGDVFPEIRARKEHVKEIIRVEEEAFNKTLDEGLHVYNSCIRLRDDFKRLMEIIQPPLANVRSEVTKALATRQSAQTLLRTIEADAKKIWWTLDESCWPWQLVATPAEKEMKEHAHNVVIAVSALWDEEKDLPEECEELVPQLLAELDAIESGIGSIKADLHLFRGKAAFVLYDTYGFPLDLTELMAREGGLTVDVDGFNKLMEEQRERARKAQKKTVIELSQIEATTPTAFVGYDKLETPAKVVEVVEFKDKTAVILDTSACYAEMGGQVGDTGSLFVAADVSPLLTSAPEDKSAVLSQAQLRWEITNTQKAGNTWLHFLKGQEFPALGESVFLEVDRPRRNAIQRHHTVTHVFHWALHELVNRDATQKGSYVGPEKLTFDFNCAPLTPQQLADIEKLVNERILENAVVSWTEVPYTDVRSRADVMQLFGEKYGDTVRVVQIGGGAGDLNGYSMELCGGTHTRHTGEIGLFRLVSESAIAAGVRRVEAIAGLEAWRRAGDELELLKRVSGRVNSPLNELEKKIEAMLAHQKELEKALKAMQQKEAAGTARSLLAGAVEISAADSGPRPRAIIANLGAADGDTLQTIADALKSEFKGIVVLGGVSNCAVALVATVSPDFTKQFQAGKIIQAIAPIVGGKGGGRPDNARGGGKDASKLDEALAKAKSLLG